MWKYIFNGVMIFSSFVMQAQEASDLLMVDEKPMFALRSLQLNYNVLRPTQNLLSELKTSQELQVEVGFHERYSLTADIGFAKTNRGDTYSYKNSGDFWRAGLDINMAKNPDLGNMIGLGLRYAQANFKDGIAYARSLEDQDGVIFTQDLALSNPDMSAEWIELVFKMKVKIWKQFYTGYTMRYQFFLQLEGEGEDLIPFDIPGYGKTSRPNSFGFDYYIGWRISL